MQSWAFILPPVLILLLSAVAGKVFDLPLELRDDWFDSGQYLHLKEAGYTEQWRTAFFPAFPFFWRALGVGTAGMALVNGLLWAVSFLFLRWSGLVQGVSLWLAAMVPSVIFFFLPYSESLFLFACVPVAVGLQRRKYTLSILGTLLASMVRPTAAVLVPALFAARCYRERNVQRAFIATLPEAFSALLGLGLVFLVHWRATGEWFSFLSAQREWGNGFGLPELPLSTYGGDIIMLFDGAALFTGLAAGITALRQAYGRRKLRTEHIFGMTALAVTALLILFSRGGGIFSLNRFIFATAFFPLALDGWRRLKVYRIDLYGFIGGWLLFSLFIGSFLHVRAFMACLVTGAFIALFFSALTNSNTRTLASVLLILLSTFFVCFFYLRSYWIA